MTKISTNKIVLNVKISFAQKRENHMKIVGSNYFCQLECIVLLFLFWRLLWTDIFDLAPPHEQVCLHWSMMPLFQLFDIFYFTVNWCEWKVKFKYEVVSCLLKSCCNFSNKFSQINISQKWYYMFPWQIWMRTFSCACHW